MTEYLYDVGIKRKATGEALSMLVWAESVDQSTRKLCGVLIGVECEYEWRGSGPVYENNEVVKRQSK